MKELYAMRQGSRCHGHRLGGLAGRSGHYGGLSYGVSWAGLAVIVNRYGGSRQLPGFFCGVCADLGKNPNRISGERPWTRILVSRVQAGKIRLKTSERIQDLTGTSDVISKKRATGSCDERW